MAKITGFNIRESGAIGILMSCKGLVELIALNVGFQAGILDARTFSMFVVQALVLTFMVSLSLYVAQQTPYDIFRQPLSLSSSILPVSASMLVPSLRRRAEVTAKKPRKADALIRKSSRPNSL